MSGRVEQSGAIETDPGMANSDRCRLHRLGVDEAPFRGVWKLTRSFHLLCTIFLVMCRVGRAQVVRPSVSDSINIDVIQRVVETYFSPLSSFGYYTPCAYPTPQDADFRRRCFISDRLYEQNHMCNLDGAISNTEMDALATQLSEMFVGKRGRCQCEVSATAAPVQMSTPSESAGRIRPLIRKGNETRNTSKRAVGHRARDPKLGLWSSSPTGSQLCWYKMALAFISHLPMPTVPLPQNIGHKELCNSTVTASPAPKETEAYRWTPKATFRYGMKFAQMVRERWRIAQCNEDILFLVVIRRPDTLGEAEENNTGPVIFASWGDAVEERTAHLTIEREPALLFLLNLHNKLLADQDRTKLKYYLSGLLYKYFEALSMADQTTVKPNPIRNFAYEEAARLRNKQHIPDWALGAFGGCAVLLVVMALGYCLVKSRVRRGASRPKPGADGGRRWKAGFVGEFERRKPKPIKRKRRTKLFPIRTLRFGIAASTQLDRPRRYSLFASHI